MNTETKQAVGEYMRVRVWVCAWARVALLIFMSREGGILFSSCPTPPHLSTVPHKGHDFRKNVTECKICFDFL